jgi:glycine cleavage system aminomethyltransferase T
VWQVGGVTVVTTSRTLDQPIGYPYVATSITPVEQTGGQPVAIGNRYAVIQVAQSVMSNTAAAKTDLFTLLGSTTQAHPVVAYLNRSDTSEAYRCYRQGAVGVREAGPAHYSVPTITLREVGD